MPSSTSPTAWLGAAATGSSSWQRSRAGGGHRRVPEVKMLPLPTLLAANCPLLPAHVWSSRWCLPFPLALAWDAYLASRSNLKNNSSTDFILSVTSGRLLSVRDFLMIFFFFIPAFFYQIALYWDPATQTLFPVLMFLVPLLIPFQPFHHVPGMSYTVSPEQPLLFAARFYTTYRVLTRGSAYTQEGNNKTKGKLLMRPVSIFLFQSILRKNPAKSLSKRQERRKAKSTGFIWARVKVMCVRVLWLWGRI